MDRARLIKEFTKLVAIDSPSLDEKEMSDYIKHRLITLGFSVSQDDAGSKLGGLCGNVYGYLAGNLPGEPLLFSAHMDTVEPSCDKRAIISDDGIIRSDGKTVLGADDCVGIATIFEALQTIKERALPHRPIEVLFTVAEELYCGGATYVDYSRIIAKEAYVLDLTGPVGTAARQAPTILLFEATVHGKAAHAGFEPENGIHALAAAAHAVDCIQMGRIDGDTTVNIGTIEGGLAPNIVPERCILRGEVRSFDHEKALRLTREIESQVMTAASAFGATADFEFHCGCRAYETPAEHPVIRRFEEACQEVGLPPVLQQTFGGSDNNYFAQYGITGIVIAAGMNQCHTCQEYTSIEELSRAVQLTVRLMTSGS